MPSYQSALLILGFSLKIYMAPAFVLTITFVECSSCLPDVFLWALCTRDAVHNISAESLLNLSPFFLYNVLESFSSSCKSHQMQIPS